MRLTDEGKKAHDEFMEKLDYDYEHPDYGNFEKMMECAVPGSLRELFDLKTKLQNNIPLRVDGKKGILEIQHFFPMSNETIQRSKEYSGKFFQFAISVDGDPILYCLEPKEALGQIHISWDMTGDVEEQDVMFEEVLSALGKP